MAGFPDKHTQWVYDQMTKSKTHITWLRSACAVGYLNPYRVKKRAEMRISLNTIPEGHNIDYLFITIKLWEKYQQMKGLRLSWEKIKPSIEEHDIFDESHDATQLQEYTPMNGETKIYENKHYVNGQDIDSMSIDEALLHIASLEAKIEQLQNIKAQSTARDKLVKKLQKAIKEIVKNIDAR